MRGLNPISFGSRSYLATAFKQTPSRAPRGDLEVSVAQILAPDSEIGLPRPQNYERMEKMYGLSSWVYICCRKKARDLSSAPLLVLQKAGDDKEKPVDRTHPLADLLRSVNPWMTPGQLLRITSIYLDLTGNAFWLLFRGGPGGQVTEIYPVNPFSVSIYGNKDSIVDHYTVWNFGKEYPFRAYKPDQVGDILHFRLENPTSDLDSALPSVWGVGPLEACWDLVLTDMEMVKWNKHLVNNQGRPVGMLISDQIVSPQEAQEASQRYRDTFGGAQGAGKILVLGKNLKYQVISQSPSELDFANTAADMRERILATFGLNSGVLGLAQGDIGRRDEQVKEYWQGTIVTTSQSDIMPTINEHLAPEFGPDLEVRQDFSKVRALQENEEARSTFVQRYWQMGIPLKDLNAKFNLGFDDIEGDDVGYIPASFVPVGMAGQPPEAADGAPPPAGGRPAPRPAAATPPRKLLTTLDELASMVAAERTKRNI